MLHLNKGFSPDSILISRTGNMNSSSNRDITLYTASGRFFVVCLYVMKSRVTDIFCESHSIPCAKTKQLHAFN